MSLVENDVDGSLLIFRKPYAKEGSLDLSQDQKM